MRNEHLWTIKWTQPYATDSLRPYLRTLQEQMEQVIENMLEHSSYTEANEVISRIKAK